MTKDKCWRDEEAEAAHICAYCDARVAAPEAVPGLADDVSWAELAWEHAPGCEWVLTRAHMRPGWEEA